MTLQRWLLPLLVAMLMVWRPGTAVATEAQSTATDPALEERVNHLASELRCLVCQNQSLADSHAELAIDLKNQVREQLRAGRSEKDVIRYMTERYGDFVLYRPPLKATTMLLWGGPLLLLLIGAIVLWRHLGRGAAHEADAPLDAEAAQRAATLLDDAPSPARDA